MLGLLSKRYYAKGEACFKLSMPMFKNAAYVLSYAYNFFSVKSVPLVGKK